MFSFNRYIDDPPFPWKQPISNRPGAFIYTSSDTRVATVDSITGLVTVKGFNKTLITVTQAETQNYTLGSVTSTFIVLPHFGFDPINPLF
jgi:hypothetical protein